MLNKSTCGDCKYCNPVYDFINQRVPMMCTRRDENVEIKSTDAPCDRFEREIAQTANINEPRVTLLKCPSEYDWLLVKDCALVTVGKEMQSKPTLEWMQKILEARHSPIRELRFVFRLENIPTWVSVHLVRHHVGCQAYVKSQRNDRQNSYDRNGARQDAPVDMIWSMNADALMTIAAKRLCMKAAPETREIVQMMCDKVIEACPEFDGLFRPACEWSGGVCHEMQPCGARGNERDA